MVLSCLKWKPSWRAGWTVKRLKIPGWLKRPGYGPIHSSEIVSFHGWLNNYIHLLEWWAEPWLLTLLISMECPQPITNLGSFKTISQPCIAILHQLNHKQEVFGYQGQFPADPTLLNLHSWPTLLYLHSGTRIGQLINSGLLSLIGPSAGTINYGLFVWSRCSVLVGDSY